MGFWKDFFMPDVSGLETKGVINMVTQTPQASAQAVSAFLLGGTMSPCASTVSAVHACARVIAEGLALPPCYVHRYRGSGKTLATDHPLFTLLNQRPNDRQTSYEFREMLGWQLALNSNAYVWINRLGDGTIAELLACDPGKVTVQYNDRDLWGEVSYYICGIPVPRDQVWHLKGSVQRSWQGEATVNAARNAIGLASATEEFGSKLFQNGARPSGVIKPQNGHTLSKEHKDELRSNLEAYTGSANANKTMILTGPLDFQPISSTADEAQFIETRKLQIEEICRFFRVNPIKVFQQMGSHSYASVEQAHIAHDQDTDAHWHERFVQSANNNLLSAQDRKAGYAVAIDSRSVLRGTAGERMTYYTAGVASGLLTRNECREMEGFDRSDDPQADQLTPAANLFGGGNPDAPAVDETPKNKG